jgi:hypothetical protein
MSEFTVAQFMSRQPASLPGGNTPSAVRYGRDLREIIVRQAHRSPRNLQTTLGPSEIGEVCSRQVVSKFSGQPATWHGVDPWPSVVGTAVHAWLADAFAKENNIDGLLSNGLPHWITERRVAPHPSYPGNCDLYDSATYTVCDWKVLGPTSIAKIKSIDGPSRRYQVQLLLYALGYRNLGYRVDRVVLAALPRTAPSLEEMYVWEHVLTPEDDLLISQVIEQTRLRYQVAQAVLRREILISQVPMTPGDSCSFCRYYRPQAAREIRETGYQQGPGCPGHSPTSLCLPLYQLCLSKVVHSESLAPITASHQSPAATHHSLRTPHSHRRTEPQHRTDPEGRSS